jgi:hypothetical protein
MPANPAVGSILNHPALPTIFEDETMKVTCIDGTGEHCLVTFIGVGHGQDGVDQQSEEFRKAVGGRGPRLFVFDKSRSWGNSLDIDLLADVTAPYRKARSVATMGLSMGGFLAVQMSTVLGATRCVALAPQYSIHPSVWKQPSLEGCFASDCIYNLVIPNIPVERSHAELFPCDANVRKFFVESAEHNVAGALKEQGRLYPLLEALLRGASDQDLPNFCCPNDNSWSIDAKVEALTE